MIYRQRGDDILAAHHLNRAAELGLQTTLVDWLYRWHVAQAQLKEAAGDLESALVLLDEAKRVYIQTVVPDLRPIGALKARIYLKQGWPDKVRAWAAERGLSLADEVNYLREFEPLTLARLELANPQVNALLARLLQAAEAQKRRGSALDILLVQDEVICGFGRTGSTFGNVHYGMTPDLSVFAKGLGGGFPVAALGGRRDIMSLVSDGTVSMAGTYAGNTIAVAAANAAHKLAGQKILHRGAIMPRNAAPSAVQTFASASPSTHSITR